VSPTGRPRRRSARRATILGAVVCALAVLGLASVASAAEPPNQNDPCSSAGRDTCGTTGVGSYQRYRYGIRWFGDYRGAVPGAGPTFCIDLRFWYPQASYKFVETPSEGLKNRAGGGVSQEKQRKMAYALWNYGRSSNPNQQAAVMLYVHTLMGDAAPGEVAPDAIGPVVEGLFSKISRESARLHGPYRIDASIPGGLKVGAPATGTVRLIAASGAPVPGVVISLEAKGADGVPPRVRTNDKGVASIDFTPTAANGVSIEARSESIASTLPRIFRPTTAAVARNGQRLAAAASQRVSATATQVSSKATITISTTAFPANVLVGQANRDRVRISGLPEGRKTTITANIYGPFRAKGDIRCDATPASTATFTASKSGTIGTPVARMAAPGWYTYQLVIAGDANFSPVTTPCAVAAESFRVQRQPKVTTAVSAQLVRPGTAITDTVLVDGLGTEPATVRASLFGPFPTRQAIRCDTPPIWTGTIAATGDGSYKTDPFTLTVGGYYTYRETIDAGDFVRPAETACGDTAETTIAVGAPTITTLVSATQTAPGSTITDQARVSGLGALAATLNVELWGPFPTREAIACTGTPYWTGTVAANGDGTYTTPAVTLDRAGYYTYRESILATEAYDSVQTACGEGPETSFALATPAVTTTVSDDAVKPGTQIFDRIRVTGLGKTPTDIDVELFGPFATRSATRCTGTPFWKGTVQATGDGTVRSPNVTLDKIGFYTYRERIAGSSVVTRTTTPCAEVAETSLAVPAITTGRGDFRESARALEVEPTRPTRVKIASLGIDAPVASVGIDLAKGQLDVPVDIQRTGWWRDGAAPGDATGSVLIAGHVDSARSGPGAFFKLSTAKAGDRVQLVSADGRTRTYKVTSVRRVLKEDLPADVFSIKGRARLTLVTCGGTFDPASGHYKDNIIVTAIPV
jgi:LPXTG-site transpeptidase (sortase) family protein